MNLNKLSRRIRFAFFLRRLLSSLPVYLRWLWRKDSDSALRLFIEVANDLSVKGLQDAEDLSVSIQNGRGLAPLFRFPNQ